MHVLRPRRTARCARLRTATSRRLLTVSLQTRGHSPACNAAPPASRTGLARLENFSCAVREGYYLCEEPQKVGLDPRVRRGKEWRGVKAAQGESRTRRRRTRRCMGCRARCGRSDQSQVVAFVFTCDALGPPAPRSMGRHSHRRRAVAGGWTAGQSLFSAQ